MLHHRRQSNLFAAEDWESVYKSFQNVDFRAYDFDSLKQSMITYIKEYYPEDFNDYIESSEYLALVELMAWLGTSLAFRVDLNSRENFLDTAERRESIIRLARMLNYQPKRNIAATGLFKIVGVETTQPLIDSFGRSLKNTTVFWNDANNPDSFDQFTQILNNVFIASNPFGRPVKNGTVGGINTSLYQLDNVTNLNVANNISINVNNESMPFDITNPDFTDGETFFERHPQPSNPMHFVYRNDGQGLSSVNTGFFVQFKQGTLNKVDNQFDFPKPNRVIDIDVENINNTDVWVQEINESGEALELWTNVPTVTGNNVAYNNIAQEIRTIYSVISGLDDTIQIKFSDGNLGETPTGIYRTWVRSSINKSFTLRTDDARDLELNIPYYGRDNQKYSLRILFQLEENISNSSPSETDEDIKKRAPQVYYTQNRMVNNQDYNIFPLTYGNEIKKVKSINRTHAGHSRFIDINDPTGVHSDVLLLGEDGVLYKDDEPKNIILELPDGIDLYNLVNIQLQNFISENGLLVNWFYDTYIKEYENKCINYGETVFNIPKGRQDSEDSDIYVKTMPDRYRNDTGYLTNNLDALFQGAQPVGVPDSDLEFITASSWVRLGNDDSCAIHAVSGVGFPSSSEFVTTGPVEFSKEINDLTTITATLPAFRRSFSNDEIDAIMEVIEKEVSFVLAYDINGGGKWRVYENDLPTIESVFLLKEHETNPTVYQDSWCIFCEFLPATNSEVMPKYSITSRGTKYVFESEEQVRFFYDVNEKIYDSETGQSLRDTINIIKLYNTSESLIPLEKDIVYYISGIFMMEDGHMDQRKVLVEPADTDADGVPEDPEIFDLLVGKPRNDITDENKSVLNLMFHVFFKKYEDYDGYTYFRPWSSSWYDLREYDVSSIDFTDTSSAENQQLFDTDLYIVRSGETEILISKLNELTTDEKALLGDKIIYEEPAEGGRLSSTNGFTELLIDGDDNLITGYDSVNYRINVGRAGNQNTNTYTSPVIIDDEIVFKWKHYAPTENRIDPSISNIIDMIVLTNSYNDEINVWKDENKGLIDMPQAPSTELLRLQFGELNNFKMLSDQIVFLPASYKILFGSQALPELQATFKVVKIPTSNMNDNEIKAKVIQSIDEYFSVDNWDFGESFYYTELAAYIHQQLVSAISSIVIVPTKYESQFGNLFQIKAESTELFLSTATVANVEIVANLTETNMRL